MSTANGASLVIGKIVLQHVGVELKHAQEQLKLNRPVKVPRAMDKKPKKRHATKMHAQKVDQIFITII